MDEWYEELDYEENPFSTNPSDFLNNLVARDGMISELIYRVSAGSLVFLEGENGSGKTSLLRKVIKKFRGRGKVIYVNSQKFEKKLNIEDLLVQRNGLVKGMLLKKKPKKMILLLDNVSELSFKNMERIKNYFDENYLHSVIFAGDDYKKVGFSDSLKQRLDGRVLKIPKMTSEQVVQMVVGRLGDSKFFSEEIIKKISSKYDNNPKNVLSACEDVAEYVVGTDSDVVTENHVNDVLKIGVDLRSRSAKQDSEVSEDSDVVSDSEINSVEDDIAEDDLDDEAEAKVLETYDVDSDDAGISSPSGEELDDKSDDDLDDDESDDDVKNEKYSVKEVDNTSEEDSDSEESDDDFLDFFEDDEESTETKNSSDSEESDDYVKSKVSKKSSNKSKKDDLDEKDSIDSASEDDSSTKSKPKKSLKSENNEKKSSDASDEESDDDSDDDSDESVINPIISEDDEPVSKKVVEESDDDFFEDDFFEDDEDDVEFDENDVKKKDSVEDESVFDDFFDDDVEDDEK